MKNTYIQIKIEFLYAKDRFNRVFYVKSGIELDSFVLVVLYTLRCGLMDHLYCIETSTPMMKDYDDATVDDLPYKSMLIYDYGDNWRFVVTRYKTIKEIDDDRDYILISAKGRGIWEDFIGYFYDFIDGRLTDETELDEDYNPLPYDYKKPSDFDEPIDINKLNELINQKVLHFDWW